jgi:peroxiredoxin family protein
MATLLKGQGVDVAVLFVQEALVALAEGKFGPSPLMARYAETMIENQKKLGMPTDPMENLNRAKSAGVPIYACGGWAAILGVRDQLPAEMEVIPLLPDITKLFTEAKKVISLSA